VGVAAGTGSSLVTEVLKTRDTRIICNCLGMRLGTIEKLIERKELNTTSEVMRDLRVGTGCGCCQMSLKWIVDDMRMKRTLKG